MAIKVLHVIKTASVLSMEVIASILLSIVIAPIGLTLALLNELVRLIVSAVLEIQNRGNGGRDKITLANEGADNIWTYEKPNNGRMCLALLFCANPIDITQHRKLYLSRVINYTTKHGRKPYEKMRKILTIKYGYHCHRHDDTFDIQNHVKVWPGTEKPEHIVDENQLMNDILPELFKDMDESKPQWEEVIIPKFQWDSNNATNMTIDGTPLPTSVCSVRIFRYHHGLMDGASNLLLWVGCMTEDQGASFPFPVNPLMDSGRVSKFERFLYDLSCVILGAFTMAKSVISASQLRSRYVTTNYSGKRHFGWSEPLNVELLRKIKATHKSSVPSMLATALGGAFRKLDEKFPNSTYGSPEEVVVGLVSALVPYPNHDLRNQFTVVHCPVNTGSQLVEQTTEKPDDALKKKANLQRLQLISQKMISIGRDPMVYLNFFMFKYFGRFPAVIVQAMMENGGLPVVFSNVPMSTEIIEFWGNPVITAAGWPPLLTNTGLGIVTMRYAKHMRFCAVTDEACMSPEALKYFLQEVATELKDLAEECSEFETVIHKSDNNRNDSINMMLASNGNNTAYNSYINPKNLSINTTVVTMDFRRGSVPSQIIDTIDD